MKKYLTKYKTKTEIKTKSKQELKLGYGISFPFDINDEIPEYSIENIKEIKDLAKNFYCIQVMFSKPKITNEQIVELKEITKNYKKIFVHASYQINMGADLIPDQTDLYNTGIEILINEIQLANKLNASGIVLHMGKNVSNRYDPTHIYNNMVKFIVELFKKLKKLKITLPILLETPAGQGGEMCWDLKEFVEFVCKFKSIYFYSQLGVCIDTCHIFQAGNDLNNIDEIKQIHKIFDPIKEKIRLIHLNDSYHQMGARIDRHEQIGKGQIQIDKLIKFIYPYKSIPMILETVGPYEEQIKNLTE